MIHTQTEIDNLVELAIIQRAELKKLVESLPQLRDHLSSEIERNLEEIEPAIRSELEQLVIARAQDAHAQSSAALTAKVDELGKALEVTTAARYSVLMAEREQNATLLEKAEARIAEAASALPNAVKSIVTDELSRFPRAGEIDQLRKEFAEPRGLNPRGKWTPNDTYQKLDLVTFNGDSFVSNINDNRERPGRNATNWTLSAARGHGGGGPSVASITDLIPAPSDGQILGSVGPNYVPKNLVAGANITINQTSTDITIIGNEGEIELTDGTEAAPSLFFVSDTNTGMYRPAADTVGIVGGGNDVVRLTGVASATDYLEIKNGTGVGAPLHVLAEGASTNIGVHLQPKGSGLFTISDGTDFNKGIRFRSSSSAASAVTLIDAVSTAGRVVTLPDATDTLVGRATTDTLTNKTLTSPTMTTPVLGTPASGNLANCTFPTLNQSTTGNAATATALQTARAINGVNFDGTAAITVTAAAGTLSGNTLAAGVTASSLTSLGTIASLTATAGTVANAPSGSTDIANKSYVDSVAQGLDAKASCVAATTANITLSGAQTIDDVSVVAGNRVLVKNQSLSQNNGIYLCASGSWTRTTDANTWDALTSAFTFIEQGTVNADCGFVCTANAGGTLGTTALPWSQFSGAGTFTAGTGLTLTGSVFSLTSPVAVANGGTGLTSLGSGVATFLGTPSSANLAAAVTDETGSGALVFATSPTLVTPNLGTPSAAVLTSATGLPLTTGVTGTLDFANGGTNSTTSNQALAKLTNIATTVTSASPVTLTATSANYQIFTGSTSQTVILPVTSTLETGWSFSICNNSSAVINIQTSAGTALLSNVPIGTTALVKCIATGSTAVTDWEANITEFSTFSGTGSVVLNGNPSLTAFTCTGNATIQGNATMSGAATSTHVLGTNLTTGTATIGGTATTGTLTFGQSTVGNTINIDAGATASGSTKTLNIGTGGLAGSTTAITIGSTTGTSTNTLNGITSGAFNGTVGATTPSTGAFTTVSATGETSAASFVSSRFGVNSNPLNTVSTAQSFARFQSTGADFYVGTESSTGGGFFPGSTAYAAVLYNANATPMHFYTGGTIRATVSSTGLAVIGAVSSDSLVKIGGTVNGSSGLQFDVSRSLSGVEWFASPSGLGYGHRAIDDDSGAGFSRWKLQGRVNSASWTTVLQVDGTSGLAVTGALSATGALAIGNTVAAAVAVASTHKVTIVIGGVTYYLLASNV